MGMANTRNESPTVHWALLKDFAENQGTIDSKSPKDILFHHMPKRKPDSSKKLLIHFKRVDKFYKLKKRRPEALSDISHRIDGVEQVLWTGSVHPETGR